MVTAINFLLARPAASLAQTAALGLTSSTVTPLIWPTPIVDATGMWASAQPTRLTPTKAGYYSFTAASGFVPNATGARVIEICRNGQANVVNSVSLPSAGSAFNTFIQVTAPWVYCNGTTDYVEVYVDQSSGTTPLNTVPSGTTFTAKWESN